MQVFKTALVSMIAASTVKAATYNIMDYGAKPDDTATATAFTNADALNTAFSLAGQDSDNAEVLVPAGYNFTIMPVDIVPQGDEF